MLLTGNLLQTSVLFSEMTHLGTPLSDRSSEQALISDILGGNTAGFESLIRIYQGRVFATARKYARKESEIEDIVQEIFIKAFRKLDTYRMDAPFEHWLMKIAIRTCYDYLRKHQRSRMASFTDIQKEDFDLLEVCGEDETDARHQREAAKSSRPQPFGCLETGLSIGFDPPGNRGKIGQGNRPTDRLDHGSGQGAGLQSSKRNA